MAGHFCISELIDSQYCVIIFRFINAVKMLKPLVQKVFCLNEKEMPRIAYSWLLKVFLRIGIVLGWTTIIAMFVTNFGIKNLPFLFLIQSVFTILSMLVFSFLVDRFKIKDLIVGSAFLVAITFFAASLFHNHGTVFFALSIIGYGVFIPQIMIFLSSYVEEFFSPWECERVLPIVESSETIGGIIGGLLLSFLAPMAGYKMLFLWIIFLFCFIGSIFIFCPKELVKKEPLKSSGNQVNLKKRHNLNKHGLYNSLLEIRKIPFLQSLLVVFFIQWIITYLFEYRFTKVVEEGLSVLGNTPSHEANLTHNLGLLHIILNSSALFIEFLVGSRILKLFGTVGGFLLHSLVTLLSVLSLFIGLDYFTSILARNNFEITSIVHRNSYEASYYALKHGTQKGIREFIQAFIFPLGTIAGTLLLILIESFFVEHHYLIVIQLFLFILSILMVFFSFNLQNTYTDLAVKLLHGDHLKSKLHGVEILSQKGHSKSFKILIDALNGKHEDLVKIKIIEVLSKYKHLIAIPHLLKFKKHKNIELRKASVEALANLQYNSGNI